MLHQDFPAAAMRIQSILYRLLLPTATDSLGLEKRMTDVNKFEFSSKLSFQTKQAILPTVH